MNEQESIIVRRAARELSPGMVVNLGIGLPTLIPGVLPEGFDVVLHSENGFAGMGAPLEGGTRDNDVIDAGGRAVTLIKGAACFDSVLSFALIRGGHLDMAVLGAFEVSVEGDLANWMIPGKLTPGMGGGMELAQKARRVVVISRHLDKHGRGKLVGTCSLPLTAPRCVDTLITERAVFRRREGRLVLCSIHPEQTRETVFEGIECPVEVAETLEPWE
ncbi:MAG: acetate CoA/acetoacetate CoA-transferase beta subunit [Candidatus Sumerlaeota bacterium]|nr:acetate CoA/acetoacetate CoA-transferase beta subunit [Candidatus Sumerlaeota bacterium]